LNLLLEHLGTRTVIIAGFSADSCVSFTAHDAYLREYRLVIPSDGTASCDNKAKRVALLHLASNLRAQTPLCSEIRFRGRSQSTKLVLPG
jgi:nicotinamidase-related amidase